MAWPFTLTARADRSVAYAQEVDANIKCEAEGRQARQPSLAPNAAPMAPAALRAGRNRDGEAAVHLQEAPQAQVKAEAEKAARAAESEAQEHEKREGTATEAARAAGEKAAQQVIFATRRSRADEPAALGGAWPTCTATCWRYEPGET